MQCFITCWCPIQHLVCLLFFIFILFYNFIFNFISFQCIHSFIRFLLGKWFLMKNRGIVCFCQRFARSFIQFRMICLFLPSDESLYLFVYTDTCAFDSRRQNIILFYFSRFFFVCFALLITSR